MSSSSSSDSSSSSSSSEDDEDKYSSDSSVESSSSALTSSSSAAQRGKRSRAGAFIARANDAAQKIQKLGKVYMARKRLKVMCSEQWEAKLDEESGTYCYIKKSTGETRWEKPTWFINPQDRLDTETKPMNLASLRKVAKQRLQYLRENRPKVDSTDWPLILPSGNRYEGQTGRYGSDKAQGVGVMSYLQGGRYCGEFVNGRRHGWGVMTYPDGSTYEGEWVDDRITGMGAKTETNGTRYEGQWELDEFQGIGIYIDARGMTYQGEWERGTRHGYGVEWIFDEASDGRHDHRAGRWDHDEFLNDTPRECCDLPDESLKGLPARTEAKKKALEVGKRARFLVRIVAENRSKALQAARRGNDERKRTMLTTDVKRLREMGAAMKRKSGGASSKQHIDDPYTTYLEAELESALRKQKAVSLRYALPLFLRLFLAYSLYIGDP